MTIHIRKQSQFELFPSAPGPLDGRAGQGLLFKNLTLSSEHIIVLGIILLMSWVFFFSLGVEKGKGVTANQMAAVISPGPQLTAATVQQPNHNVQASAVAKPVQAMPTAAATDFRQLKQPAIPQAPLEKAVTPDELIKDSYTIQVASFKTSESARKEAEVLQRKGFEVYVISKGSHTIICVGKFALMEEAKRFLNKLKNKYNDCLVRRI